MGGRRKYGVHPSMHVEAYVSADERFLWRQSCTNGIMTCIDLHMRGGLECLG